MGKCVVIGLQSTGEARTLEAVEVRNRLMCGYIHTTHQICWGFFLFKKKSGLWIRIHLNPDPNQIRILIQTESGSESRTGSKPDLD
jgi:hypothetical protein